jgi:hypothetical protein
LAKAKFGAVSLASGSFVGIWGLLVLEVLQVVGVVGLESCSRVAVCSVYKVAEPDTEVFVVAAVADAEVFAAAVVVAAADVAAAAEVDQAICCQPAAVVCCSEHLVAASAAAVVGCNKHPPVIRLAACLAAVAVAAEGLANIFVEPVAMVCFEAAVAAEAAVVVAVDLPHQSEQG